MSKQNALAKPSKLSILFIGNSYTYTNDMPGMISQIAKYDSKNKTKFEIEQYTVGGAKLKTLWDEGKAVRLLKTKHWDFLVLQEQSSWAMYPIDISNSYQIAPQWNKIASPFASRIILFVSWAKQPNSSWYTNKETAFFKNAFFMQQELDYRSQKLAQLLGATPISIGDYWAYVTKYHPEIPLYNPDGSHPSVTGTYFTALLFYRYFTGKGPLDSISYLPKGVKPEHAKTLIGIVAKS